MAKVQFNPSTGKVQYNPNTSKVMMAAETGGCAWTPKNCEPYDPCFLSGDNVPRYLICTLSGIRECDGGGLWAYNGEHILEYQIDGTCSRTSSDCAYWSYADDDVDIYYTAWDTGGTYTWVEIFRVSDCNYWFADAIFTNGTTCHTSFANLYDSGDCPDGFTPNCGYDGTVEIVNPCA